MITPTSARDAHALAHGGDVPEVHNVVHMPPRPPNLPRPLLGELTDNQKALVITLGTACFSVLGFVVQSKLDERWGGLQEVCTPT